MQCKDISDRDVLKFLAQYQGQWATWFPPTLGGMPSVRYAMPRDIPEKLCLAEMRMLVRRGFVGGCPCGCRGDFEITDAGLAFIGQARTKPYSGY